MSNLAQWSALVGFLIPILVAVIQQPVFTRPVRTVIGVIMAVLAAVVTAAVQNQLTWNTWATSVIWVATFAFTTYRNVWVPLGAIDWIEALTSKHSLAAAKAARAARTGETHGPGAVPR